MTSPKIQRSGQILIKMELVIIKIKMMTMMVTVIVTKFYKALTLKILIVIHKTQIMTESLTF